MLLSGFYLLIKRFLCTSQFFFLQIFNKKVEVVSESKVYISLLLHIFCYYVLKQLCDILLDFLFHPNLLTKLSKVGSTKNIRHSAGGGDVKVFGNTASIFITKQTTNTIQNIEMQKNWKKEHKTQNVEMHPLLQIHDEKVEFRVGSRVGSLANVTVLQCCAKFLCFLVLMLMIV